MHYHITSSNAVPRSYDMDVLRRAFQSCTPDGSLPSDDDHWRACARAICGDARTRGARIEELIISLKRAWATLPDVERVPRQDRARLLSRLVTLCVEEYYGPLG